LTHDDVAAFSNALEVALPELRWHCIHVGNSPIRHEYATVEGASNCDLGETNDFFRQAYTKLPFGDRSTLGMLLLNFVARYQKIIVPERDFGRHPAASPCSRSGVAALRWSKHRRSARRCESHRAPDRVGGGHRLDANLHIQLRWFARFETLMRKAVRPCRAVPTTQQTPLWRPDSPGVRQEVTGDAIALP